MPIPFDFSMNINPLHHMRGDGFAESIKNVHAVRNLAESCKIKDDAVLQASVNALNDATNARPPDATAVTAAVDEVVAAIRAGKGHLDAGKLRELLGNAIHDPQQADNIVSALQHGPASSAPQGPLKEPRFLDISVLANAFKIKDDTALQTAVQALNAATSVVPPDGKAVAKAADDVTAALRAGTAHVDSNKLKELLGHSVDDQHQVDNIVSALQHDPAST